MILKQQTPRSRLAERLILQGADTSPIQHPAQGFARLAQALAGTYMRNKDENQQNEASRALLKGVSAEPWKDPDAARRGVDLPELTRPAPSSGGFDGGIAALSGLDDNPYAGRLAAQLALGQHETRSKLASAKDLYRFQQQNKAQTQTSEQKNWQQAQNDPGFADFLEKTGSGNTPSAVQEYQFLKTLPPEEQKLYFLNKRAATTINLGGTQATLDPRDPTQNIAERDVTLKPGEAPEVRGAQAEAAAIGKAQGETAVTAQTNYPNLENQATEMISLLDMAMNHPGMSGEVGVPNFKGLTNIPGTDEAGFRAVMAQIQGKTFLEAYESLKGGGVITEVEGQKATQALARLSTAQKEDEWLDAMRDFKSVVERGLIRAQERAGRPASLPQKADPLGIR